MKLGDAVHRRVVVVDLVCELRSAMVLLSSSSAWDDGAPHIAHNISWGDAIEYTKVDTPSTLPITMTI